jgi:hypothetical protein
VFGASDGYAAGSAALWMEQPISPAMPDRAPSTSVTPEPTVTVEATRETITYTLPVSEARLPASLSLRAARPAVGATGLEPAPLLIEARAQPAAETQDTGASGTSDVSESLAYSTPPAVAAAKEN